jgi:hypothetical protein
MGEFSERTKQSLRDSAARARETHTMTKHPLEHGYICHGCWVLLAALILCGLWYGGLYFAGP